MKRVLIIEGGLTVRMDLDRAFRAAGWAVTPCGTAAEAREALAQGRFDAAVAGVLLPDAAGMDLVGALKGHPETAGLPTILLGSPTDAAEGAGGATIGADAYAGAPHDSAQVVATAEALTRVPVEPPEATTLHGRILAVDDSPSYLAALCAQLEQDGDEVVQAGSGQQALDVLAAGTVDCILLDMLMPGLSGLDVCRRVKASPAWRAIPVVMLTGRDDREAILECFDAGADDYVTKTGDFVVLRARLRAQLRRRRVEVERALMRDDLFRKQIEVSEAREAGESARRWSAALEQRIADRTAEVRAQADQLRALASELTQAEQRERKRLATILHDHIQQLLVAAQIELGILKASPPEARAAVTQGIESTITEAIAASRSLAVELSPPILHTAGLAAGLSWLAGHLSDRGLATVRVRADPDAEPGNEDIRLLLFESVRELLLNTLKHSGVREASVTMTAGPGGGTQIVVEDAGRGFDPSVQRTRRSHGFGLFSIQERLAHLGGRVEIESAPGAGTRVVLRSPPASRPPVDNNNPGRDSGRGIPADRAPRGGRPIRVLIVDDHDIMRQGLVSLLRFESDLEVAGEARDGQEAVEMTGRLLPDVVVMDVNLPTMNGVEATRVITREWPQVRVIGLSMHADADVADSMRSAGAIDYLTKGSPSGDLVAAIRAACPPPSADVPGSGGAA